MIFNFTNGKANQVKCYLPPRLPDVNGNRILWPLILLQSSNYIPGGNLKPGTNLDKEMTV